MAPARPSRDVMSRMIPHARIPETIGRVTMEAALAYTATEMSSEPTSWKGNQVHH